MRFIRVLSIAIAFLGCLVLLLISLNVAQRSPLHLHRFRETTWIVHAALLGWVVARTRDPSSRDHFRRRVAAAFASARFFRSMMAMTLVVYLLNAISHHLAFQTFSHDFTMIDDALYGAHSRGFLDSSVLGRHFLSEHFSPILLMFVPLHAALTTPWLLVLLQPLALWAAAWPLKRILDEQGVTPALRNMALLVYLNHPITISTLSYLFHMECLLPLCLFASFLYHKRDQRVRFAVAILLALSIKEDVGIYVAGLALWIAIAERRWRRGVVLAVAGLAWTVLALHEWMPHYGMNASGYPFLSRWSDWGDTPLSIAVGYLQHPLRFVSALWRDPLPRLFACLAFLPFLRPRSILLFAAPWLLNTTSSNVQQHSMSLYYGMPFLTLAVLASICGLKSAAFERIRRRGWSFAVGWIVLMLNVAHLTFPRIPLERPAVLRQVQAIPEHATVQAMSCFFPVLDYAQSKELLESDSTLRADYVLLRRDAGTWPLSPPEVEALLAAARRQEYDALYMSEAFAILRRAR